MRRAASGRGSLLPGCYSSLPGCPDNRFLHKANDACQRRCRRMQFPVRIHRAWNNEDPTVRFPDLFLSHSNYGRRAVLRCAIALLCERPVRTAFRKPGLRRCLALRQAEENMRVPNASTSDADSHSYGLAPRTPEDHPESGGRPVQFALKNVRQNAEFARTQSSPCCSALRETWSEIAGPRKSSVPPLPALPGRNPPESHCCQSGNGMDLALGHLVQDSPTEIPE